MSTKEGMRLGVKGLTLFNKAFLVKWR